MAATLNISLSPQLAKFVREKVESGVYTSASEVVREALRWFARHDPTAFGAVPSDLELQEQKIDRDRAHKAVKDLLRLRKGKKVGPGMTTKDLRDAGRR